MPPAVSPAHLHRTIWYMGAKARIIPGFLERVLDEALSPGDTVVDLMSGSGVVSAYLADRYRVFANDVQHYSAVITRSLVEHEPQEKAAFLRSLDPVADLSEAYHRNLERLHARYSSALKEEERLLDEFAARRGRGGLGRAASAWTREYRKFLTNPAGVYPGGEEPSGQNLYAQAVTLLSERSIRRQRRNRSGRPAFLVTAYYANIYFGLRQSLQIDSVRAAIDELGSGEPFAEKKRVHYLSALLHAASVSTSGTSHFAQPRHLRKDGELAAMARRRSLDIFEQFSDYSAEIVATLRCTSHVSGNRVFQSHYGDLLGKDGGFRLPGGVDLIYLDPPYTADNYSRFYHVLEVLSRYHYPELQRDRGGKVVRGRYPVLEDRFQSDFCRVRRVEQEFRNVIRASAVSGAKLVISYADPTGLLLKTYARRAAGKCPVARFRDLCRESYRKVRISQRPMMHSGQGDSNLKINELLIVCTEPG